MEQCIIYVDDVTVFGTTYTEHLDRLRHIFEILKTASSSKPETCELLQLAVVFLEHSVSMYGVLPNEDNISKIRRWTAQTTATITWSRLILPDVYKIFYHHTPTHRSHQTQLHIRPISPNSTLN